MIILFLIFIDILFLGLVLGLIGMFFRLCFYLSPFLLLYLLLKPFCFRRPGMYRRFYY